MLVRISKINTTINLDRFNYVRAAGEYVEAGLGLSSMVIAECETELGALALEQAISDAWCSGAPSFDVCKWCQENKVSLKQ